MKKGILSLFISVLFLPVPVGRSVPLYPSFTYPVKKILPKVQKIKTVVAKKAILKKKTVVRKDYTPQVVRRDGIVLKEVPKIQRKIVITKEDVRRNEIQVEPPLNIHERRKPFEYRYNFEYSSLLTSYRKEFRPFVLHKEKRPILLALAPRKIVKIIKKFPPLKKRILVDELKFVKSQNKAVVAPFVGPKMPKVIVQTGNLPLEKIPVKSLSTSVQSAIKRELAKPTQIDKIVEKSIVQSLSQNKKSILKVSAQAINLGVQSSFMLKEVDLRPYYSPDEVLKDVDGQWIFNENLKDNVSLFNSTLLKADYLPTHFEVLLEKGKYEVTIPVISRESYGDFLNTHKLSGRGGIVLVDMDDFADDAELMAEYESKIFLNKSFQKTTQNFRYVLFLGVDPGNTFLSLKTGLNWIKKVIHVVDEEVVVDLNSITRGENIRLELFEENVFGQGSSPLNLDPKKIMLVNTDRPPVRRGLNSVVFENVVMPFGERKFIEFGHTRDPIYVGISEQRELRIPTNEYIVQVFNHFFVDSLDTRCLIQLNFKNPIKSIKMEGKTARGPMSYQTSYLENDGKFESSLSPRTSKIFILGESEGLFNIQVKYYNEQSTFLKTYCSEDTYLIEIL